MPGQLIILKCQTQPGSLPHFKGQSEKRLTVSSPIPLDVSMNFRSHKNKKNKVKYFISIINTYPMLISSWLKLTSGSFCMLLNGQSPNYLPCQNVQY